MSVSAVLENKFYMQEYIDSLEDRDVVSKLSQNLLITNTANACSLLRPLRKASKYISV